MSAGTTRSFLFPPKAFLGPEDLRRLTQTVVFLADTVWVPASAQVAPALPESVRTDIARRFSELVEIGALRTWDIERQSVFISERVGGRLLVAQPDINFPAERYHALHETVMRRLIEGRAAFLGAAAAGSFDGVTEIVLGKHTLGTFAMRELTGCDDILLDPLMAETVKGFMNPLIERSRVAEGAVEEIQYRLALPDVSELAQEQIVECRRLMPAFRAELFEHVDASSPLMSVEEARRAAIDELLARYREEIERTGASDDALSGGWSLAQLAVPDDAVDRIARTFFGYAPDQDQPPPPPALLLLRLRQLAAQLQGRSTKGS